MDNVRLESIFHPSDFSEASAVAFAHALKMALVAQSKLSILHVSADHSRRWEDFPGVRETLERWRLIPRGSPKSAVANLGIDVEKIVLGGDPVKASLAYLDRHPTDLIVLAVHQYEGRMRWLRKAVGGPLAKASGEMTLYIPHGVDGFVSLRDGSVWLHNILVPITKKPRPQPAIEAARRLIENLKLPPGVVTILHVGPASDAPAVRIPESDGWSWERMTLDGDPSEVILQTAESTSADLIVMTTDGPEGFLDGLRGTTSERVLRKTRCPIVNIPIGSILS